MVEVLTNLIIFWNTKGETVLYLVEMIASFNALIIFPKKTSPNKFSNSFNHIKEGLVL